MPARQANRVKCGGNDRRHSPRRNGEGDGLAGSLPLLVPVALGIAAAFGAFAALDRPFGLGGDGRSPLADLGASDKRPAGFEPHTSCAPDVDSRAGGSDSLPPPPEPGAQMHHQHSGERTLSRRWVGALGSLLSAAPAPHCGGPHYFVEPWANSDGYRFRMGGGSGAAPSAAGVEQLLFDGQNGWSRTDDHFLADIFLLPRHHTDFSYSDRHSWFFLFPHQKVIGMPGALEFTTKALLGKPLGSLPPSFHPHSELERMEDYAAGADLTDDEAVFLLRTAGDKPPRLYTLGELARRRCGKDDVASQFVDAPLLMDGRKFELSVFVTVTSAQPLRAYINAAQWLLRFAPVPYNGTADKDGFFVSDDFVTAGADGRAAVSRRLHALRRAADVASGGSGVDILEPHEGDHTPTPERAVFSALADAAWEAMSLYPAAVHGALGDELGNDDVTLRSEERERANYTFANTRGFVDVQRFDFLLDTSLDVHLLRIVSMREWNVTAATNGTYGAVLRDALALFGYGDTAQFWLRGGDEPCARLARRHRHVPVDKLQPPNVECEKCIGNETCATEACSQCTSCADIDRLRDTTDAALEHAHRPAGWLRLYPPPVPQEHADDYVRSAVDNAPDGYDMDGEDVFMHRWLAAMCIGGDGAYCY